jgi:hypothetical protein
MYMKLFLAFAALLAISTLPSLGQTVPPEAPTRSSVTEASHYRTLFKLGLSVHRGLETRDLRGLYAPLTIGVEHQLSSRFSAYANLMASFEALTLRKSFESRPLLNRGGAELGGRYYYNQTKRMQRGRAAGPYVGNYLALQVSTDLVAPYLKTNDVRMSYDFSGLTAFWGMQRRLGRLLVYDLNAGLGVFNSGNAVRYNYTTGVYASNIYNRRLELAPILRLNLSLAR